MSTIKVHVVKGVNSYTSDLLKKQNRNINKRREVNFNVDSLNEHERSSSRAKSFAIYKPPTKFKPKSTTKNKTDTNVDLDSNLRTRDNVKETFKSKLELSDEEDFTEKFEKFEDEEDLEKSNARAPDQEDSDTEEDLVVTGYGFADQNTFYHENDNDEANDQDYNDKEGEDDVEDILGGDCLNPEDKYDKAESITFEDVFNSDDREKSTDNCGNDINDDENWGYNFSSNRDREDSVSLTNASDKESNNVFQKFRDKIKEKYDKSGFKEMHDRNMETLRKQFKSVLGKKKGRSDSRSSEETDTGTSEYWESKDNTNLNKGNFIPKPYGFGANRFHQRILNYDSDDDSKKRCCC